MIKKESKIKGIIIWFYILVIFLIGICAIYFGTLILSKSYNSIKWPKTDGVIISSHVDMEAGSDTAVYSAKVTYRYNVGGINYLASKISYGDYGSSDSSHANNIIEKYPTGKVVQVFYKLEDPKQAVLEPGLKLQSFFLLCFGVVLLLGAIFFMVGTLRNGSKFMLGRK